MVFGVHTFTPRMGGKDRRWHVDVMSNRDRRIADPFIAALTALSEFTVGDNEPYSGRDVAYTLEVHAGAPGLPHCSIEIRQDLVADPSGVRRWADILGFVLEKIMEIDGLHRVEHF